MNGSTNILFWNLNMLFCRSLGFTSCTLLQDAIRKEGPYHTLRDISKIMGINLQAKPTYNNVYLCFYVSELDY